MFDEFMLARSSLFLNSIEGYLWAENKSAQNLIVGEFLLSSIVLLEISQLLIHSSCLFGDSLIHQREKEKERERVSGKIVFIAELSRAKRASGAPWVRKFGKLSIRENLVIT